MRHLSNCIKDVSFISLDRQSALRALTIHGAATCIAISHSGEPSVVASSFKAYLRSRSLARRALAARPSIRFSGTNILQAISPDHLDTHSWGRTSVQIDRLLDDAISSSTPSETTISSIVRQLRRDEGFAGSYDSVRNYILRGSREDDSALEYAYDLITRLPKSRALDLLRLLRCKVPMPSPRLQPFVREVGAFEDRLHENTESASASSTSSGCGKCFRRI